MNYFCLVISILWVTKGFADDNDLIIKCTI